LNEKTNDDELRAMISEFDLDQDGESNFDKKRQCEDLSEIVFYCFISIAIFEMHV
jgi:hypothetical protein